MSSFDFTNITLPEVFTQLGSKQDGFTSIEAKEKLATFGQNSLDSKELSALRIFGRQFSSGFTLLLLACTAIMVIGKEYTDALFIVFFIVVNVILGFWQEYKSEKTVEGLKKMLSATSLVLRDGKQIQVESRFIVPGDIVFLQAGDTVPADIRIIKTSDCTCDESSLTGESLSVAKNGEQKVATSIAESSNMVFAGTSISSGSMQGVVVTTAMNTVFGTIGTLVNSTKKESGFELRMNKLSKLVMVTIFGALIVFIGVKLLVGAEYGMWELLFFALALAIGVVPEGLPLVTTFSFSRGAAHMAKKGVITKRLSAVEDLGAIEILCTDKTGTLTKNLLSVKNVWGEKEKTLSYGFLCSDTNDVELVKNNKGLFECAIYSSELSGDENSAKKSIDNLLKNEKVERIDYRPFTAALRSNGILVTKNETKIAIIRGGLEKVLAHALPLDQQQQEEIESFVKDAGTRGERVIAIASKQTSLDTVKQAEEEGGYGLTGLIAFADEVKESSKDAIKLMQQRGITIKVLSGDSGEVTETIARQVGILKDDEKVVLGKEFSSLSEKEQVECVKNNHAFARLSPEEKYTIVGLLREIGHVGYMGDGVNDAPPLKRAHVGIAVSGATPVAQEAADIVLTQKDLGILAQGIHEGRIIFANTVKYVRITMLSNMGNFIAVVIASFLIPYLPMLPLQILLLNLLTDTPMIALGFDSVDESETAKPAKFDMKELAMICIAFGLISTLFDVIMFMAFKDKGASYMQTAWFVGGALTELAVIFSLRTKKSFMSANKPPMGVATIGVLAGVLCLVIPFIKPLHAALGFSPISTTSVVLILVIVVGYFIVNELVKKIYFKKV